MNLRESAPRVHGAWTHRWWAGDRALGDIFGPAPSFPALDEVADRLTPRRGWQQHLDRAAEGGIADEALVVLAGQQPVLAGGPALVAHKAATAVALARMLSQRWSRPVVPVFLLATHDHDSAEVDHVDFIDPSTGSLRRSRARLRPRWESFARSTWDPRSLSECFSTLVSMYGCLEGVLASMMPRDDVPPPLARHVADLLHAAFGEAGLLLVEAHRLPPAVTVLRRALDEPDVHRRVLADGARAVSGQGLAVSFDPDDPRPLVLTSSDGRRSRVPAKQAERARALLERQPEDVTPHAALRPIAQAASLPVVAQVCGPSELLYLGQARALHAVHGEIAPVLVPRLEATCVAPGEEAALAGLDELERRRTPSAPAARAVLEAAERLRAEVTGMDPALAWPAERFRRRVVRDVQRLAERPGWQGRHTPSLLQRLRPRGRPQDTVLAWLPDAWAAGAPTAWVRHVVDLCRPLEPPVHVIHSPPRSGAHG